MRSQRLDWGFGFWRANGTNTVIFLHSNAPRAENDHCSFPGMQHWPWSGNTDLTGARCLIKNIRIKTAWHICFHSFIGYPTSRVIFPQQYFVLSLKPIGVGKQLCLLKEKEKRLHRIQTIKCSPLKQHSSSDHHLNTWSGADRTNAWFPWLSAMIQSVTHPHAFLAFIILPTSAMWNLHLTF